MFLFVSHNLHWLPLFAGFTRLLGIYFVRLKSGWSGFKFTAHHEVQIVSNAVALSLVFYVFLVQNVHACACFAGPLEYSTLGECLMKKIRSGRFLGCRDRTWASLCPGAAIQMYRSLHIHLVSTTHGSRILSSCHHQTTACCGHVGQLEEKGVVPSKVITDAPKPSSVLSPGSHLATSARTGFICVCPRNVSHEMCL